MSDSSFLAYYIRRVNTLVHMRGDIEFIAATRPGLARLKMPAEIARMGFLRMVPVAMVDGKQAMFLVKRKDTGKHEDWLEDYELDPLPDAQLLCVLNKYRAARARAKAT